MSSDPLDDPDQQIPDLDPSQNPILEQQRLQQELELQEFYARQRRRMLVWIAISILLLAILVVACHHIFGPEAIIGFLEEYWPVMIAPVAGWILGRWAVRMLYRPSGKVVICLNPDTHVFRAVFIPDPMFRFFDQAGNNVLYHSPLGMPVYVAERIDTESGDIQYSWIHDLDALTVMTREEFFENFSGMTVELLKENLQIKGYPYAIALGYTRKTMREQFDLLADALGLTGRDFRPDTSYSDPYPDDNGGEHERDHRLHQGYGARPDHSRRLR